MTRPLRLLCVLAHPDDESLGMGGTLAKYGAQGVETYVVCATRGERGWRGPKEEDPGLEALGQIREAELREAARVLGVREVAFLDYIDGDLDKADPAEATCRIVHHLRRLRPDVVVSFGPDGSYGHPDHIAICQLTAAALVCAAQADYAMGQRPHRVAKFYYLVDSKPLMELFNQMAGGLGITVDGVRREFAGWDEWAISARIDASDYWQTAWQAILCHQSQSHTLEVLGNLPEETHRQVWGQGSFYRVYSLVNGGRQLEHDLFEGLC